MKINTILKGGVTTNIVITVSSVLYGLETLGKVSYLITLLIICLIGVTQPMSKTERRVILGIIVFFMSPIVIHFIIYRDYSWFYLVHYSLSIYTGMSISRYFQAVPFKLILVIVVLLEFIFIVSTVDGNAESVNRTYLTVPIVSLFLCIAVADYFKGRTFDIISLILVLCVAIASYSRSTAILASLVVFIYFCEYIFRGNYRVPHLLILISGMVCMIPLFGFFIEIYLNTGFAQRLTERGLDTGRVQIWALYVAQIDFRVLMIGMDTYQLWGLLDDLIFMDEGRHTLHNSYLQLHSHGGLIPVIAVLYYMPKIFIRSFSGGQGLLVLCALGLLFSKSLFDVTILPQRFDFLLAAIVFYLMKELKK